MATSRDEQRGEDKRMTVILGSEDLEGYCVKFELDRDIINTDESVVISTFCYYAGVLDDEPK